MSFFIIILLPSFYIFFFFNDTATTEIYTLSLHDALPILRIQEAVYTRLEATAPWGFRYSGDTDRKSTRLNSSHLVISYAVFCLKKKKIRRICDSDNTASPRSRSLASLYDIDERQCLLCCS